jgi:hypothetical protein
VCPEDWDTALHTGGAAGIGDNFSLLLSEQTVLKLGFFLLLVPKELS